MDQELCWMAEWVWLSRGLLCGKAVPHILPHFPCPQDSGWVFRLASEGWRGNQSCSLSPWDSTAGIKVSLALAFKSRWLQDLISNWFVLFFSLLKTKPAQILRGIHKTFNLSSSGTAQMEEETRKTLQMKSKARGGKGCFCTKNFSEIVSVFIRNALRSLQPPFQERIATGTPLAQGKGSSTWKMQRGVKWVCD